MRVLFDTGSANPWIVSKKALEKEEHKELAAFDPSISTTYFEPEDNKKTRVTITFGSGKLKGYFVKD